MKTMRKITGRKCGTTGWNVLRAVFILSFFHSFIFLTSCSEEDNTVEEFPDWQNRNEQYFEQQYRAHAVSAIIKKWSIDAAAAAEMTDCILVDVLEQGSGTASPYFNDTVEINYAGRLIPSTSYKSGYEFDKSFRGTYDPATTAPCKLYNSTTGSYYLPMPSTFVSGFATALMHMHRGDHWRVTIPYQLGYGANIQGSIPAYSTLIFDIWLTDFWSEKKGDRSD